MGRGERAAPAMLFHVAAREERIAELEDRLAEGRRILAALPEPVLVIDDERRVTHANPAADLLFGQQAAGRALAALVRNPEVTAAIDAALGANRGAGAEFIQPVPVERVLSVRIEPILSPDGDEAETPIGAVIALHDITQVKRAERLRSDFLANVSHELRTPLASLLGFVETLRGPARDDRPAQDKFLAIMDEQAQRMARLIADLLSLSRIEMNEHSLPQGSVDAAALLRGVADALSLKAQAKSMRIELPSGLDSLPALRGDSDELTQVFQNLIDNAIKYGRSGTAVRIGARTLPAPGRMVAFDILDEGEGIAPEHLPRLTERFYRVDKARSREVGGTGLGLAIVKHIVNRHRGRLEVESEPGRGSRFTVLLPTG